MYTKQLRTSGSVVKLDQCEREGLRMYTARATEYNLKNLRKSASGFTISPHLSRDEQ